MSDQASTYQEIIEPQSSYNDLVPVGQQIVFNDQNSDPRVPCVLLVDCSGSMSGARIEQVNRLIHRLQESLLGDSIAKYRVEMSVVQFNDKASVVQDFALPQNWPMPQLKASGGTSMGAAINMALDLLENRKKVYRASGTEYYRPWLILLTDGYATDTLDAARKRVMEYQDAKKIVFLVFGIGNSDKMIQDLKAISKFPLPLDESKWDELQDYLLANFKSVSSSAPSDMVQPSNPAATVDQTSLEKYLKGFTEA